MDGLTSVSALLNRIGGKGLATEAATAWVRAAFDEFRLARLGAFVHPENHASIRILEKLGFHAERREMVMGMDSVVFFLDTEVAAPQYFDELRQSPASHEVSYLFR